MERIATGAGHLEGEKVGSGPPVLLIHGAVIADSFEPFRTQGALADHFQLMFYHRRGFGGSADHDGPFSIVQQAADAVAVLDHFDIDSAHVVGHSYGAVTALQLALDAPERVRSLVLAEPPLLCVPSATAFGEAVAQVGALYESGDKAGALAAFSVVVDGPDAYQRIDPQLPAGWSKQALADIDLLFQVENPALMEWPFGPDQARTIELPALALLGDESGAFYQEGFEFLKEHVGAEGVVIAGSSHSVQMIQPKAVADAIAEFLVRQQRH